MDRIYSIVCRDSVVMTCDSLTNKALYKKYNSTKIGCLYAVRDTLVNIYNTPIEQREDKYTILLPNTISALGRSHTVNYWLQHRVDKNGNKLDFEFLGLVADIVGYMNALENVKLYTGSMMKYGSYIYQFRGAWKALNTIVPPANTTDKDIVGLN